MIDPDRALRMVRNSHVIAYDTETNGLTVRSFICGYVVTDNDASVYVPVRHDAGGNILAVDEFERELADAFAERSRKGLLTVGHNLGFDLRSSLRHGVVLSAPLEDTMINEGLINYQANGYGLDDCCKRYGVAPKLGHDLYVELATRFGGVPDRKQMAHFWRLEGDNKYAVDYATGDGVSTLQLWRAQQPYLDEEFLGNGVPPNLRAVHKLECDLIPYLAKMHHRGMKVSSEHAEEVLSGIKDDTKAAKESLPPGFNVRSPKEVEAAYKSIGVTDYPRTALGAPSFTEKWLSSNDLGRAILRVRQLEKAGDSFIAPLVDTHNVNGRVHPVLNQSKSDEYGAIGGRLSCSEPNLQAFPKRNKEVGQRVRKLIVPDFGVLDEADFSQQEPRLFTHYSEEPKLIDGYNRNPPIDIHDIAVEFTGLPRDTAKRMGLGILTGMYPKALAGHMGWSVERATEEINKFLDVGFPQIRKFQHDAKRAGMARGYVRSILGRVLYLPENNPKLAYKMVSRVIQGGGADHTKTMLLRACQFCESVGNIEMLMTVHDSFIWQREPDANVKELVRIIEDVQSPPFNLIVPIPVELASGTNWSEASYGRKLKDVKKGGWVE